VSAPTSLPRQHFALVFLALLITAAGNTALQSVLPVIARAIRIPDMGVAFVFSLSALIWTFSAPYWAHQSDQRGRRLLMQVGTVGFGVSMLLCAGIILAGIEGIIAPLVTFLLFTLARALFGVFGSAGNPAAQAFVASRTTPADRTNALAMLSSAFGLGTIIGPAVAPFFILPVVGLSGPMFAFAFIAILMTLLIRFGLPDDDPTHLSDGARGAAASIGSVGGAPTTAHVIAAEAASEGEQRRRLAVTDARVKPFMIFGFAAGSLQAATGQALGFLIIDRIASSSGLSGMDAAKLIGIAFMAGAAATLLAQWGIIRILNMNPSQLMRWGAMIAAAGTLGIALAPDFHALVIAFALQSVGFGFARPGFTAGSSLAVGRADQGAVAGAVTSVNGACFVLAPAIGIGLYELVPALPWWLGAAGCLAIALFAWVNPLIRNAR
jgi:MFS family permease